MKVRLIIPALMLMSVSCSKDKFQTKPSIEVKSITNEVADPGVPVEVFLKFTDKEGDLGLGEIVYIVNRLNIKPIPGTGTDRPDTVRNTLPDFPKKSKGEIQLTIPYDFLNEDPDDNDSVKLKIAVRDFAGNASDTIQTGLIIARQN